MVKHRNVGQKVRYVLLLLSPYVVLLQNVVLIQKYLHAADLGSASNTWPRGSGLDVLASFNIAEGSNQSHTYDFVKYHFLVLFQI